MLHFRTLYEWNSLNLFLLSESKKTRVIFNELVEMKQAKVEHELTNILKHIIESEPIIESKISEAHNDYHPSAKNLYRYLILRSFDLRGYHDTLSDLGISSIRTGEGYVFSNLYNVVRNLSLVQGNAFKMDTDIELIGYKKSKALLKKHANSLFNDVKKPHFTEIMVTIPEEAAENEQIIRDMVIQGMEVARINLSHGDIAMWQKMIRTIHKVRQELNADVKIYMDLSGPKIRTAQIKIKGKKGKFKKGIPVRKGERIILTKNETNGRKSIFNKNNQQIALAEIGVLLPQIIDDVSIGEVVLFDDGMITSEVIAKRDDEVEVVVTNCYK